MISNEILMWCAAIISLGGALTVLWKIITPLIKKTKHLMDSLNRFTSDWFGEEEAPGRDRVPGVMERLNNIDGELKHNGGSTMKDAVKRIEKKLNVIEGRLLDGDKRMSSIEEKL
jgi:hypothetical protein